MNVTVDGQAAYPASAFTILDGLTVQPDPEYRMHWYDGENGGGVWTLVINDDLNNANGGKSLGA